MRSLLSLIGILALALLGTHLPNRLQEGRARDLLRFFGEGYGLVLIGILIGPLALQMIDRQMLETLYPLQVLTLAWIGLLFGLQFDFNRLKGSFSRLFFLAQADAWAAGLITALACLPWLLLFPADQGGGGGELAGTPRPAADCRHGVRVRVQPKTGGKDQGETGREGRGCR